MAFSKLPFDLDENGQPLMNCMTLIAGKDASATGRVMVGHNEDDDGHIVVRHSVVPANHWPEGTRLPAEEGLAQIPQVPHTLGYYWVEFRTDRVGLSNSDMFYNDHGVVIVTNSMGTSRAPVEDHSELKDGGLAFNLRRCLAERATSAREGVRILMELVKEWGYAPSGRAYTIADKDEAFMFQLVHGRRYVGARVPDDAIVVMPNFYNFHTLHDCPEMYYSPDIIEHAIEMGWYAPNLPGCYDDFDFALAYQDPKEHLGPRNVLRQKHGQRIALGRDWDVEREGLPFCVPAVKKVDVKMMEEILSTHYEGTPDRCEWFGPGRSPHDAPNIRSICTGTTLECAIFDIADEVELTTAYTYLGRPCQQPMIPLHPMMGLPEALTAPGDPAERMQNHLRPDPAALHTNHTPWQRLRRVEAKLEMLYQSVIADARAVKDALFAEAMDANDETLKTARRLRSEGRMEEARRETVRADAAFLERAAEEMEALRLNTAAVETLPALRLSAMPETLEVVFAMEGEPSEEALIFGLLHTDTRQKFTSATPGSLKALGGGRWKASFSTEKLASMLSWSGLYDCILGGATADGHPFQGVQILAIQA